MLKSEYQDLSRQYLAAVPAAGNSAATQKNYKIMLEKFAQFLEGSEAEEITPRVISEYRSAIYSELRPNSVQSYLAALHAFFSWAVRLELLPANPMKPGEIPHAPQPLRSMLSTDEIAAALFTDCRRTDGKRATSRKNDARNRAIIALLILSGLRNSELRDLRLDDIDFEQKRVVVRHGKGEQKRIVALPPYAEQKLNEYLAAGIRPENAAPSDYLFGTDADENGHTTNGKVWKPFSSAALNGLVKRYVKYITGKEIHCHTLRHCAASLWDAKGVSMRSVQQALGHKSIRTTENIYVHVLNKSKAADEITAACSNL